MAGTPAEDPGGQRGAVVGLLFVQVFFGGLAVAGKIAFADFPPLALAALRVGIAAVVLWVLQVVLVGERVAPRHLPRLFLFSLFGIVGNQLLFLLGLERTDPVAATVLVTTIPVFTLLVAVLFGVEKMGWQKGAGITLAFAGVVIMVGVSRADFAASNALGNLLVTLNALSYAIYLVIARDILRVYKPITVAAWTFTFGSLIIIPIGIPALHDMRWAEVSHAGWAAFVYIILFATVATYILNNWALTRVASSTVAVYIYLQPFVSAVSAYVVLSILPTTRTWLGAACIFAGLYFAVVSHKRLATFGRVRS